MLPGRAGNDSLIVLPVARVVLSCSVNERLRSDWGDFLRARNENPARQFKGGVSGTRMQKGGQGIQQQVAGASHCGLALLHKPYPPIVFNDSRALAQGDWCPGPTLTSSLVGRLRELKVFDTSQVLYDVLAVGIPHVDAVSEMGAIVYRHFSLPQSSSASRFTAGAAGFFILSQSGERPER